MRLCQAGFMDTDSCPVCDARMHHHWLGECVPCPHCGTGIWLTVQGYLPAESDLVDRAEDVLDLPAIRAEIAGMGTDDIELRLVELAGDRPVVGFARLAHRLANEGGVR